MRDIFLTEEIIKVLIAISVGYFIGAIPFAYIVAKISKGVDIRKIGSGNPGATNVYRSVGKMAGVLALALDAAKGMTAVLIVSTIFKNHDGQSIYSVISGLAAIGGHIYTAFLNFKGGKGVATGLGVFAALAPAGVVAGLIAFAIVYAATKYVSASSITAAIIVAATTYLAKYPPPVVIGSFLAAAVIILRHRANILRLIKNTETKTNL